MRLQKVYLVTFRLSRCESKSGRLFAQVIGFPEKGPSYTDNRT